MRLATPGFPRRGNLVLVVHQLGNTSCVALDDLHLDWVIRDAGGEWMAAPTRECAWPLPPVAHVGGGSIHLGIAWPWMEEPEGALHCAGALHRRLSEGYAAELGLRAHDRGLRYPCPPWSVGRAWWGGFSAIRR